MSCSSHILNKKIVQLNFISYLTFYLFRMINLMLLFVLEKIQIIQNGETVKF
jgi:hypothetical protein